jgi:hypothetical protein
MAQLVLVVLAVLAGFAGAYESVKLEARFPNRPWRVSRRALGVGCFVVGLVLAFFAAPVLIGALLGVLGHNAATSYRARQGDGFLGIPALAWAGACAFFGFMGTALTSPVAWSVVSAFSVLGGALFLLVTERNVLIAERDMWVAENRRLLAERTKAQGATPPPAVAAPAAAEPAVDITRWDVAPAKGRLRGIFERPSGSRSARLTRH